MSVVVDPTAAAERLREEYGSNLHQLAPVEIAHRHKFAADVCHQLGIEPASVNVVHVLDLLSKSNIVGTSMQEYPKWIETKAGRILVNNLAEESAANV